MFRPFACIGLDVDSLVSWVEFKASSSYPCLPTRYQIWRIDATVDGIPDGNFTTLERVLTPADEAPAPVLPRKEMRVGRWSGACLRRRTLKPRLLDIVPGDGAAETAETAGTAASSSAAGRPVVLPEELMHVWEWVDSRLQRQMEQERLQSLVMPVTAKMIIDAIVSWLQSFVC